MNKRFFLLVLMVMNTGCTSPEQRDATGQAASRSLVPPPQDCASAVQAILKQNDHILKVDASHDTLLVVADVDRVYYPFGRGDSLTHYTGHFLAADTSYTFLGKKIKATSFRDSQANTQIVVTDTSNVPFPTLLKNGAVYHGAKAVLKITIARQGTCLGPAVCIGMEKSEFLYTLFGHRAYSQSPCLDKYNALALYDAQD